MRGRAEPVSTNEREFVVAALKAENAIRVDGRRPHDLRTMSVTFGEATGHVEATLGKTRCACLHHSIFYGLDVDADAICPSLCSVLCVVTAEIVEPRADRPTEGLLQFYTELSPMAAPDIRPGRQSDKAIEIGRVLERGLRESKAIDTEALCILAGKKVWSVRVDMHVMDHDGNLVDCANLAAVAALRNFRKPEVVVTGETVVVFAPEDRAPTGLSMNHLPLCISFCFFEDGELMVLDPTVKEEEVGEGTMILAQTVHRQLCGIKKSGSPHLTVDQIKQCTEIAAVKVGEIMGWLQSELDADDERRTTSRMAAGASKRNFASQEETQREEERRNREVELSDFLSVGQPGTVKPPPTAAPQSSVVEVDATMQVDSDEEEVLVLPATKEQQETGGESPAKKRKKKPKK